MNELKVWYVANMDLAGQRIAFDYPVKSPKDAILVLDVLASRDLADKKIESNAMGLCDKDGNEWESEEGEDIHAYSERPEFN